MTSGVFGGGVIFVVAALLWAAVLVPSWVRRREFKSAEQNALRLQRTLRVLAETSEVPDEVRVEATAREALAHERLLKTERRRREAEHRSELAEARAAQLRAEMKAQQAKRKQAALVRAAKLRRPMVRRVRSISALVFAVAIIAALVGVGLLIAGVGPAVLVSGLAAAAASLGSLVLLAPGRVKHVAIDAEQVSVSTAHSTVPVQSEAQTGGTLERAAEAHAAAQAVAAARLDRAKAMARARAERPASGADRLQNRPDSILLAAPSEARAAAAAPTPSSADISTAAEDAKAANASASANTPAVMEAPKRRSALTPAQREALAAAERVRQMGIVGDTSDGKLDLDAVLRTRRRAS